MGHIENKVLSIKIKIQKYKNIFAIFGQSGFKTGNPHLYSIILWKTNVYEKKNWCYRFFSQ